MRSMPIPRKKTMSDTTLLAKKEAGDPTHRSETEHNEFYRSKAISKLAPQDKALHDSLATHHNRGNADAIIALRGGTPKFEAPEKKVPVKKIYSSSVSSGSGKRKTSGYQYDKNKPARGSISLKRKP